jgi:Flp pilus assembly protein TadG
MARKSDPLSGKGIGMFRSLLTMFAAAEPGRSTLARFFRRRDGSAAVEFAMVSLPFLGLLFAIVQTAIIFMAQQQLETATEQASRLLLTGQAQSASPAWTQQQFAAKVCAQIYALFNCNKLMIDVETATAFSGLSTSAPTLTFNASGAVTNTWSYAPGAPGTIVIMRVMYQWPLVKGPLSFNLSNLPNGDRLLMATAVFKTEPYQ